MSKCRGVGWIKLIDEDIDGLLGPPTAFATGPQERHLCPFQENRLNDGWFGKKIGMSSNEMI